jgi:hypothetical protein
MSKSQEIEPALLVESLSIQSSLSVDAVKSRRSQVDIVQQLGFEGSPHCACRHDDGSANNLIPRQTASLPKMPSLISLGSTRSLVPGADQDKLKNMGKFLSGFRRFHKTYFATDNKLFDSLKESQSPKILVVGCCDSRVDPAIITDCDPGDLFVVRNGKMPPEIT